MTEKEPKKGIPIWIPILGALTVASICVICAFVILLYSFFANDSVTVVTQDPIVRGEIQKEEVSPVITSDDQVSDSGEDASLQPKPPDWATTLGDEVIVGYTYPLGMKGPWKQSVPEDGFILVALGNGTVDGVKASSDGTQGNVFLLVGSSADGSTPADLNEIIVIDDYTPGHIQVTFIYAGNEDPQEAALSAVTNMFGEPNCGQEGCLEVTLYSRFMGGDWDKEVFTDPPN